MKKLSTQNSFGFLAFLCLILFSFYSFSQQQALDSLNRNVQQAASNQKAIAIAELARATLESNPKEAVSLGKEALALAKKEKDAASKAFSYATLGYLAAQQDLGGEVAYLDSGLNCANKISKNPFSAYVWLRKGWLDLVQGNNENAIKNFLKADSELANLNDTRSISYKILVNHYMASIYAYGSDTAKHHRYAVKCFELAKKSKLADDKQLGYMTIAHGYFSAFEQNRSQKQLLDSSMFYYKTAIEFYQVNKPKIYIQGNTAAIALNIANGYFKYYPISYQDSAKKYIDVALEIARRTKGKEVIANCYGLLSEFAMKAGDVKGAEQYLLTGLSELETAAPGVDITRSRLMLGLAQITERSGDLTKALTYYKQYIGYHDKVFDAEKLATVQKLEEQYQSAKRDSEINRLKQQEVYTSRLNWLYLAIGASCILLLALLLSSYHYKLKSSQKQKMLSEQKAQEAELLVRLQETEAERLSLEKQEAELQVSLREEEKAKLDAQRALLKDRTEWLERELLAGTLRLEEKNTILELLKDQTKKAEATKNNRHLTQLIKQNLRMDKSQEEHQQVWNEINPSFFSALQARAENALTKLDLKYCAYILMGLDNKEMALRLGVEPKSIRMAKYRLKQKLKLDTDDNLDQFILQL